MALTRESSANMIWPVIFVQTGSYQLARWVSTFKRACVYKTDQLSDGKLGSSPETGFWEASLEHAHKRSL